MTLPIASRIMMVADTLDSIADTYPNDDFPVNELREEAYMLREMFKEIEALPGQSRKLDDC